MKVPPALISLSLFIIFLAPRAASAQTESEYFPLAMGDSWVYTISHHREGVALSDTARREVAVVQADGTGTVAAVKNVYPKMEASYQWFRTGPEGVVAFISLSTGPDRSRSLMDFDPPLVILPEKPTVGASWEMKMRKGGDTLFTAGTSRVESADETVTVPAGTFRNCLKVKMVTFDENGKETATTLVSFAKGVGQVLSERSEPNGNRYREELISWSRK